MGPENRRRQGEARPRLRLRTAAALIAALVATGAGAGAPSVVASAAAGAPHARSVVAFIRQMRDGAPVIWALVAGGGAPRRLGPGADPLVSPDGMLVAAATGLLASREVLLYPSTGGSPAGFELMQGAEAVPVAWSADSRYLAVEMLATSPAGARDAGLAVFDTSSQRTVVVARGQVSGVSFAAGPRDEVIFGLSRSSSALGAVNLYESPPDAAAPVALTHDGRSFDPLWTVRGIVFDRERLRGLFRAPAYQLWLMSGGRATRLTDMRIPPLLDGLIPLSASADGNRLLAEYVGEDTSSAWTVALHPLRLRALNVAGSPVQGAAISRSGAAVLVDSGAFMEPANRGTVESVPFGGRGPVRRLARGATPSWNL